MALQPGSLVPAYFLKRPANFAFVRPAVGIHRNRVFLKKNVDEEDVGAENRAVVVEGHVAVDARARSFLKLVVDFGEAVTRALRKGSADARIAPWDWPVFVDG